MKRKASDPSYSEQLVQLLLEFSRLKPRLIADLPEELRQLKDRLPEVTAYRAGDYDAFLRISNALYRSGELTMSQLSEALGAPLSTTTRLADWLVRRSYAQRLPDPDDRRIVRVRLTPAGRELHEAVTKFLRERVDRLLSALTQGERRTLVSLLRKMKRVG